MRRDDLLDLNEVLQHPGRTIAVEITTELESEEDLDLLSPLDGELEAVSTGNVLLLKGHFKATVVLECARCSEPVESLVEFEIEEHVPVVGTPSSLNPREMAKVAPDEPDLFEENSLAPEVLLRQLLLVNLPMQVHCPACEAHEDESQSQAAPINPKLAKLSALRSEGEE